MTQLENWSRLALRGILPFLCSRKMSASELHRQLSEMYESDTKSSQQVIKQCRRYACVRDCVTNEDILDDKSSWGQKSTLHASRNSFSRTDAQLHGVYLVAMVSLRRRVALLWLCYSTLTYVHDGCFVPKLKIGKNDHHSQLQTTLLRCRETVRRVVFVVVVVTRRVTISLPPVSDQTWSGSTMAQIGRISLTFRHHASYI